MGLRTGSSTAERGAWPRSLRGTIVAGPTPSRAHDNDCLCLPAASTSHQSEAGKKESPDHHLNPACQPCAEPSSISSCDCRLINARTADNGSAQNGSTNKSAKVVLGCKDKQRSALDFTCSRRGRAFRLAFPSSQYPVLAGIVRTWRCLAHSTNSALIQPLSS